MDDPDSSVHPLEDIKKAFTPIVKGFLVGAPASIPLSFVQQTHSALQIRHFPTLATGTEHSSLLRVFFKTISSEGVGALFRGVGYPLLGQAAVHGVLFGTYYTFRSVAEGTEAFADFPRVAPFTYKFAGACAGFFTSFIECPVDLVCTQMRTQAIRHVVHGEPYHYRNHIDCAEKIVQKYSARALYYGWLASMVRSVGAYYVMFSAYESQLKSYASKNNRPVGDVPLITAAYFGAFAGAQGVIATYLFANVKNVIQADHLSESRRVLHTITDAIHFITGNSRHLLRAFNGLVPAIVFAIPAYGSLFVMVTFLERRLWGNKTRL